MGGSVGSRPVSWINWIRGVRTTRPGRLGKCGPQCTDTSLGRIETGLDLSFESGQELEHFLGVILKRGFGLDELILEIAGNIGRHALSLCVSWISSNGRGRGTLALWSPGW